MIEKGHFSDHMIIPVGMYLVNFETRECWLPDGSEVKLTNRELDVLVALDSLDGRIVSASELVEKVTQGEELEALFNGNPEHFSKFDENGLRITISNMRKKLGYDFVENRQAAGYILVRDLS